MSIKHGISLKATWLLIGILLLMTLINLKTVQAKEVSGSLSIESKVGYDGQYYSGFTTPVFVTLQNELGRDLSGDIVFNVNTIEGVTVTHTIPVEIANQSVIDVTFYAQGYFDAKNNSFQFYEGGIEKNNKIKLEGTTFAKGNSVNSPSMIGIVSSNPDTLNFLLFLNQQNYQLSTVIMNEDFSVENTVALEMFSVLVLNDVTTSNWSEQKVNSIKEWVINGGTLLFGGGAGYAETVKAFEDIVPVAVGPLTTIEDTQAIDSYAISDAPIGPLAINNGQFIRGTELMNLQKIPVIASNKYGEGEVIYTAFDLALRPFSTWEGRTSFVQAMLSSSIMPDAMNVNFNDRDYAARNAIGLFPHLKAPSVMILLLLFSVYAFIIAPLLYIFLKKADKREWAWWIIPSSAIITTIVVIFVGSLDKRENYLHQINVVESVEDYSKVSSWNSIFLASSRDLKVEVPTQGTTAFITADNHSSNSSLKVNKEYVLKQLGEKMELNWQHNNYWTTRSFVQKNMSVDPASYGSLEVEVTSVDVGYSLLVRNNTGKDLEHVALLNGSFVQNIGNMTAGSEQKITITQPPQLDNVNQYGNSYFYQVFTSANAYTEYNRESSLLDNYSYFAEGVHLVGFSYGHESDVVVNNKKVKTDEMTMWKVSLNEKFMAEMNNLHAIKPTVQNLDEANTINHKQTVNEFYLESGSLLLRYQLPSNTAEHNEFEFSSNMISYNSQLLVEIYNVEHEQWEPYALNKMQLLGYLDENQVLQMKMSTAVGANGYIPTMFVNGDVK